MGLTGKIIHKTRKTIFIPGDFKKIVNKKISNTSSSTRFYFFASPILSKNKALSLSVAIRTLKGSDATIALADRDFTLRQFFEPNQHIVLSETKKVHFLTVIVPADSEIIIDSIESEILEPQSETLLAKKATSEYLLITTHYPSSNNSNDPYNLHQRVASYIAADIKLDVVEVGHKYTTSTSIRTFSGVTLFSTNFNALRTHLQKHSYKKIIVADFSDEIVQILDATDKTSLELIFLANEHMLHFSHYDALYRPYFSRPIQADTHTLLTHKARTEDIRRYAEHDGSHWVFISQQTKDIAEKTLDLQFKNSTISKPYVSLPTVTTRTVNKAPSIAVVGDITNFYKNGFDTDVRALIEFSSLPSFTTTPIDIYWTGEGDLLETLIAPLEKFENITIHKKAVTVADLPGIFLSHDIFLNGNLSSVPSQDLLLAGLLGCVAIPAVSITELLEKQSNNVLVTPSTASMRAHHLNELVSSKSALTAAIKDAKKALSSYIVTNNKTETSLLTAVFTPTTPVIQAKLADPVLTVVIPSYNVQPFLRNCVDSLVSHKNAHKIEILVVNDGSKDQTAEIARELEQRTLTKNGSIVRLIDKENGGHGSTINAGIREAKGKYFRLLDGDDYFITKNFEKFIDILEGEDSDIVLTDLVEDYAISATKAFKDYYASIEPGVQNDLTVMNYKGYGFGEWGPLLSTTTCKTQLLKDAQFAIDEHCFYVDMEYNFIIYSMAKNVTYYPLTIYSYYLGRAGQSMSKESMKRNVLHHEKVTLRLIKELYERRDSISPEKQAYIINKLIVPLVKVQYYITTEFFNDATHFNSFDTQLRRYPEFYNGYDIAGTVIKFHRAALGRSIFADSSIKKLKRITKR